MTLWAGDPPRKAPADPPDPSRFTDDPLAALGLGTAKEKRKKGHKVYAVSRINPLFQPSASVHRDIPHYDENKQVPLRQRALVSKKIRSPIIPSETNGEILTPLDRNEYIEAYGQKVNPRQHKPYFNQTKPREKSPEIDYDTPRRSSVLSEVSEGYIRNNLRQKPNDSPDPKTDSSRTKPSVSSGYGGSNTGSIAENAYNDRLMLVEEAGTIFDQNPAFVKSIRIAGRGLHASKSVPSQNSSCSVAGTLTTIPEGRIDQPIPQPIWPGVLQDGKLLSNYNYDSLVDEALLLYTSLSHVPENNSNKYIDSYLDISVKDLLVDLLVSINQTMEGKSRSPEEMLKIINEKIKSKLDALKNATEEEMKKLCVNLSNSRKVSSVLRAFSNGTSSENSSSSGRVRTSSSNEDLYHIPSGSSSSGFSDSSPGQRRPSTPLLPHFCARKSTSNFLPFFNHHDTSTLSKGIRNALIYGTLCRAKMAPKPSITGNIDKTNSKNINDSVTIRDNVLCAKSKLSCDRNGYLLEVEPVPKRDPLKAPGDEKPSVWELYYGVKAEGDVVCGESRPSDVPVFPGGRPEADFTLDMPRSELLSRRMRENKKWRFRCRLLTSFLSLVFFLLSVMAVSLILTKGKRMFGSMV